MKTSYYFFPLLIFTLFLPFPFSIQAQIQTQDSTLSPFRSLRQGSRGSDVLLLQKALQQKGYFPSTTQLTTYFGAVTRKAVINFQKANHLPLIGVYGPLTNAALTKQMTQVQQVQTGSQIQPTAPTAVPTTTRATTPAVAQVIPRVIVNTPINQPLNQPPAVINNPQVIFNTSPTTTPAATTTAVAPPATAVTPPVIPPVVPPVIPVVVKVTAVKIGLPLYIYPSPGEQNWTTGINASNKVEFIIANVNSGPGASVQSDWTNMINTSVAAGVKIYGYVDTNYGAVSGAIVDANVNKWLQFYPNVTGIFLDQTASDASKITYYKARYDHIKSVRPYLQVVINPGTNTDEGYMAVSDVNIIFESSYSNWLSKQIPAWVANYPKERFYAIVYDVATEAAMKDVVKTAKLRNFGKIYVTNAPTPSDPLPSYFQSELLEASQ